MPLPEMVMLELRPLDARKQQVEEPYKFPHIEIDNLVFLRVPADKMKPWEQEAFRDSLVQAAGMSGVAWSPLTEVTAMIDALMKDVQDGDKKQFTATEVLQGLSALRSEVAGSARPTNKTFVLLSDKVRFLEVKEKWEKIPEPEPIPEGDA